MGVGVELLKGFVRRTLYSESPYIDQNDEKRCIFVHVPKCGGISIEKSILDGQKPHHWRVVDYKYYNPYKFYRYFVFTLVRNPISRFESAFSFLKDGGRNAVDQKWADKNLRGIDTADQLVQCMRKDLVYRNTIEEWMHFRPQVWYLTDVNGNLPLDYIGRIETIQEDFEEICRRIGIDRSLPHKNKSMKSEADLLSNEGNIAFLREEVYNQDIKALGYE